jgi:TonB family protein
LDNIPIAAASQTGALLESLHSTFSASEGLPGGQAGAGWNPWRSDESPEVLSGPIPIYPDLLRQAGVQGKVILEAVVDTTGRILPQSISVVLATNPGFVRSARQALLATLFRPAMTGGKPVRVRVRVPYEFTIRNGIGRAR